MIFRDFKPLVITPALSRDAMAILGGPLYELGLGLVCLRSKARMLEAVPENEWTDAHELAYKFVMDAARLYVSTGGWECGGGVH